MNLDGRTIKTGDSVWDIVYEQGTVRSVTEQSYTVSFTNGTTQTYHQNGVHMLRGQRTLYNARPYISTPVGDTNFDVAMAQLLGVVEAAAKRFGEY